MKQRFAYCEKCGDLVEFHNSVEVVEEIYKNTEIKYEFNVNRCDECDSEVAPDLYYNSRKVQARLEAYKRVKGIITLDELNEMMAKYDVGKEPLAMLAGFGKVTIKRYFEGFIPSKEYSEVLFDLFDHEDKVLDRAEEVKEQISSVAYKKIIERLERLSDIADSKLDQIVNYVVANMEEVTPLALQKLLFFANGVNYASSGKRLIDERSEAWVHGPVYRRIYDAYRKYGYKPIDNAISSTRGCLTSLLSSDELKVLDLVIETFGLYSPKVLETISHMQEPWMAAREGFEENEPSQAIIDETIVCDYFKQNQLDSKRHIFEYISKLLYLDDCRCQ